MIRVAIDGPAGVGKSSTSKALARYFGFAYLDTGAMYRACAWWCMRQGIDLDAERIDEQLVTETVGEFFTEGHFDISVDPADPKVLADGEDISDAIRASEVSSHVSKVSNIIPVRHVLIAAQRAYIAREAAEDSFSGGAGVVAEGRDITTVVAPDAEVRVLLTAREEVRQARRTGQASKGVGGEDVAARDRADSKVTSFLEAADGVMTVDNSDMDFDETMAVLVRMVEDAIEEQEYERYAANLTGYELDEGDEALIDGSAFDDRSDTYTPKAVGVLAIVGRPNVGKSTLVNRVLGRRAAVVEDTPGVTRDRVSYDAEWAGTDFKLVDTGGWEADVEGIDSAIASQAQIAVQLADAVVLVVDGQVGMTATDERIVRMLRASGKPVTLAVNKVDDRESEYMAAEFWKLGLGEPYPISAMHGRGVGDLLDAALDNLRKAEKTSGFLTPSHLRRVALVGRPNVGKSSLVNCILGQQRVIVSSEAGTTRDAVDTPFENENGKYIFIDTAGLRRRRSVEEDIEKYSVIRANMAIERADVCLILIDGTEGVTEQDTKVAGLAHESGKACVIVVNKWDAVEKDERTMDEMRKDVARKFSFMSYAPIAFISAKTGQRVNRLFELINYVHEQNCMRISTGRLNEVLADALLKVQPPTDKGKRLKILYMTQVSVKPPTFVIFCNRAEIFHFSYQRYLENQIRSVFGLEGTCIRFIIREKGERN